MGRIFRSRNIIAVFTAMMFVFSTAVSNKAGACHFAAADISVTYIGQGVNGCTGTTEYKYEVELIIYYACISCFGVGGPSVTVQYESASAVAEGLPGATGSFTVTDANTVADTVHQLCAQFADSNSCINPNGGGSPLPSRAQQFPAFRIRRHINSNVVLPYAREDWRFYWSGSARSNSNINVGTCGQLYVEAMLDNLTKYNNSTIKFLSNPLPYICINQPTTYLNGPYDPNGDSINVVLQPPHTRTGNTGQPCVYTAPSTYANPINSSTGFTLNSLTGSAYFTPSATGQFVLAFRGEDYERSTGKRLSYVYRDVQVNVLPCTAPPPDIDSLKQLITSISGGTLLQTQSKGEVIYACPGSNLKFDVNSKTDSTTHNVYMYANTGLLPGSTFNVNGQGTNNVTGTFEWVPTTAQVGEHSLIIESKDSTCKIWQPIVLTNYRVVLIKIVEGIDAGEDMPICAVNPDSVQLFVNDAEEFRLKWTTENGGPAIGLSNDAIHNPKAAPKYTTNYVVSTPDLVGACKSRDTVQVFIDETNKVTITPKNPVNPKDALVLCRPGYVQLEALLAGKPPKNNVPCGVGAPTLCSNPSTSRVFGSAVYGDIAYDTIGRATPVMYNTLRSTKQQFIVRRKEMHDADIFSSTIRSISFETKGTTTPNYVYSNFRILIKCTDKEKLSETDGFETIGFTQVYSSSSVTFPDGVHTFPFSVPYSWDTTKNIIVQMCYSNNPTIDTNCGVTSAPPVVVFAPTTYISGLILKAPDQVATDVCGATTNPDIQAVLGRPVLSFTYCEADPLPFEITWKEGNYLSDSTIAQPLAYVPHSGRYIAQTIGRSGCIMRDTLEIYVPKHDIEVVPADTAFCFGESGPITIYGGHFFKWYEYRNGQFIVPQGSVQSPTKGYTFVSPEQSTDFKIVVSDSVFCYDTVDLHVEVLPLPDVRILNEDDTVVKYGQSFQLLASGARYYNWSPVSSLNNPNISYPMARPTDDTRYIVGGIGANGCRAFDTLNVIVDNRDNLFVPTAFSPNGDGRNDEFRVTNLTFQRIMEFRVFNRWGQEVFSTTDSRRGWDGTWQGKAQDIGTYTYLIRVGYPDGYVETYKGEVTLIR